ncbi:unnamed protein product [Clonostachys chloroleuca]|uniref:Paxilline synthesis protein A n=1 Tax=Clonostachys chloroleuca TaxID=1926264 RepID=A0AA35Q3E3_9HYPO|nr:unnamed protein product [Clonostachys chloroleuca]
MVSNRALGALPFLLIPPFMAYIFSFAPIITIAFESMLEDGQFSLNGVKAPLMKTFYGIGILDETLSRVCVGFAQLLLFPADPKGYWQLFLFLTEFAGLYGIFILESCRGAHRRSILLFPFLIAFFGQFMTVGILSPIYFFTLYVKSPLSKLNTPTARSIPASDAVAVLPTVALAYYSSQLPSHFHPEYEARLWYTWVWQIYPVWGSAIFFVLSKTLGPTLGPKQTMSVLKPTFAFFVVLNVASYWYTLLASGISFFDIMIPIYFIEAPPSAQEVLRTIVQYDYIFTFGAMTLWLAYSFCDLKAAGIMKTSWITIVVVAIVTSCSAGLGTTVLLGWLWREQLLSTQGGRKTK